MKIGISFFLLFIHLSFTNSILYAQDSTINQLPNVFNITSNYKPTLLNTEKITTPLESVISDTFKVQIKYTNLYQLNSIKSLKYNVPALMSKTYKTEFLVPEYGNTIKLGYGDMYKNVPLIEFNFENGNGNNKNFSIYGNHYSLRGRLQNQRQDNSNLNLGYIFKSAKKFWQFLYNAHHNQIGVYNLYQPFDSIQPINRMISTGIFINMSNQSPPLKTNTHLAVQYNNSNVRVQELNIEGMFNTFYFFSNPYFYSHVFYNENVIKYNADILWLPNSIPYFNNLANAESKFVYKKNFFYGYGGVKFFLDYTKITVMPAFEFNVRFNTDAFYLGGGMNTVAENKNLKTLYQQNAFIQDSTMFLFNTYNSKYFINLHGNYGDRFYYLIQGTLFNINNLPTFSNYANDKRRYAVFSIDNLNGTELFTEVQLKFNWIQFKNQFKNSFYDSTNASRLWGIPTIENLFETKIKLLKKFVINISYQFYGGNLFRQYDNIRELFWKTKYTDDFHQLNGQIDFEIHKQWKLWFMVHNILNLKNERWGGYQELPINFSAGFLFIFYKNPNF